MAVVALFFVRAVSSTLTYIGMLTAQVHTSPLWCIAALAFGRGPPRLRLEGPLSTASPCAGVPGAALVAFFLLRKGSSACFASAILSTDVYRLLCCTWRWRIARSGRIGVMLSNRSGDALSCQYPSLTSPSSCCQGCKDALATVASTAQACTSLSGLQSCARLRHGAPSSTKADDRDPVLMRSCEAAQLRKTSHNSSWSAAGSVPEQISET